MNFSTFTAQAFSKWWAEQTHKQRLEVANLMTVGNYFHSSSKYFLAYVQPSLAILYLGFASFILFVFIRSKTICFVNAIIVLSNIIVMTPVILTSPLMILFFLFIDDEVPLPYPWCFLYLHLSVSITQITQITGLGLKILLGINRVCGVWCPFKMKFWFTKKRSIMYAVATIAVCVIGTSLLSFTHAKVAVKPAFDDLWGEVRNYLACSTEHFDNKDDRTEAMFVSNVIFLILNILGLVALVVCNVLLVTKIRRVNAERKNLVEKRTKNQKETDKRLNLMNKISIWVITATVITEVPSLINRLISIYGHIYIEVHGSIAANEIFGDESFGPVSSIFYYIEQVVLAPLDLVIFVALSKKAQAEVRRIVCPCAKKGNDNV